jgi:hypothetical protein
MFASPPPSISPLLYTSSPFLLSLLAQTTIAELQGLVTSDYLSSSSSSSPSNSDSSAGQRALSSLQARIDAQQQLIEHLRGQITQVLTTCTSPPGSATAKKGKMKELPGVSQLGVEDVQQVFPAVRARVSSSSERSTAAGVKVSRKQKQSTPHTNTASGSRDGCRRGGAERAAGTAAEAAVHTARLPLALSVRRRGSCHAANVIQVDDGLSPHKRRRQNRLHEPIPLDSESFYGVLKHQQAAVQWLGESFIDEHFPSHSAYAAFRKDGVVFKVGDFVYCLESSSDLPEVVQMLAITETRVGECLLHGRYLETDHEQLCLIMSDSALEPTDTITFRLSQVVGRVNCLYDPVVVPGRVKQPATDAHHYYWRYAM